MALRRRRAQRVGWKLAEPSQQTRDRSELVTVEALREKLVDLRKVRRRRFLDLGPTRVSENCVDDSAIGRARLARDKPAPLESVEQTRDPRRGEQYLVGEIDAPKPAFRSP